MISRPWVRIWGVNIASANRHPVRMMLNGSPKGLVGPDLTRQ